MTTGSYGPHVMISSLGSRARSDHLCQLIGSGVCACLYCGLFSEEDWLWVSMCTHDMPPFCWTCGLLHHIITVLCSSCFISIFGQSTPFIRPSYLNRGPPLPLVRFWLNDALAVFWKDSSVVPWPSGWLIHVHLIQFWSFGQHQAAATDCARGHTQVFRCFCLIRHIPQLAFCYGMMHWLSPLCV